MTAMHKKRVAKLRPASYLHGTLREGVGHAVDTVQ
jgi:hypothetical protein